MAEIVLGLPDGKLHAAPTLVALGMGYFKEYGLDVKAINAGAHFTSIPAIARGEVDVSPQGPLIDFLRMWDPDRPMVMVADQGSVRPGRGEAAIVARPALVRDGLLVDYADLKGKRVGVSRVRGDHDWLTFNAALQRGHLSFDDVEVHIVDFGDVRHEALRQGEIDVATVGRLGSQMKGERDGAFVIWKHEHEFRQRLERAITYSYRFWTEHPEEAQRFLVPYLLGLRDYYNAFERGIGRDKVLQVLAEQSGEPLEALARHMVPTSVDPNGRIDEEPIAADIDWHRQQGLLDKEVPIGQLIDYRYLDAALEQVGLYQ